MGLPTSFNLLLTVMQHIAMQAEHRPAGVFAHALGDARVEQAHYREVFGQTGEIQLIDPRR
ncbi:hypothetical protein D3C84_1046010 [compost metagenome]